MHKFTATTKRGLSLLSLIGRYPTSEEINKMRKKMKAEFNKNSSRRSALKMWEKNGYRLGITEMGSDLDDVPYGC